MDEVFLEGMVFYGYHGVHPEERALGQRFVVDLAVRTDLKPVGMSDDLSVGISYSDLYRRVAAIIQGEPRKLIEAVAEAIAGDVLATFPAAESVRVTLRKPAAPIKGAVFDAAGVTITRNRKSS